VSGVGGEQMRARAVARMNASVLGANRRDLDEIKRGRYLDGLGVRGHVAFGLYVEGFGDTERGSLCDAAVIPSSVIFMDADASAAPDAELGRAPRDGLEITVEESRETVLAQEFPDAPWTIRSMSSPGAVDLRARVTMTWPSGRASFAFATIEGANEAVEALHTHLARSPGL